MNLFDNILKQVTNKNMTTHILSYDLYNREPEFYGELDKFIQENFPWSKKPLNTFWEISTIRNSQDILNTILSKVWTNSKVRVYHVNVLDKKVHPVILKPKNF